MKYYKIIIALQVIYFWSTHENLYISKEKYSK